MGVCMKQMNNEIIYPRSEEEVLLILATAKKEGHLLEIIFDEFVKKPFSITFPNTDIRSYPKCSISFSRFTIRPSNCS